MFHSMYGVRNTANLSSSKVSGHIDSMKSAWGINGERKELRRGAQSMSRTELIDS
jgi:hypothetical protein